MSKRDTAEYKIEKASEMIVGALPPITQHPGTFIRDTLLPEYGLSVAKAARLLSVNRANFHNVLVGKSAVSRELAYKLGALMRDEVADLLIAYQNAYDVEAERDLRETYRQQIERVVPVEV